MKSSKSFRNFRGSLAAALSLACFLALPGLATSARALTSDAQTTNSVGGFIEATPVPSPAESTAPVFSPGIRDILKMLDAKVDLEVIKEYIKGSRVDHQLSAAEIIALKKRGVPDELLTAVMERGAEVRAQAVSPQPVPQSAYGYGGNLYSPGYYGYDSGDYSPYAYGYPSDYSYAYPYNYWWYNYGYPWWGFTPFFFVDAFGHHHFHDFHHDHHGDFHSGHPGMPHQNHSPFGTFARNGAGFSGNRSTSPFGTFSPQRAGFGGASRVTRPMGSFGGRPMTFASHSGGFAGRPSSFGGGFRSGGGFGGHGGSGGHR